MEISTGFLDGNLFSGEEEGIDLDASAEEYESMLRETIQDAYPAAKVRIVRERYAQGVRGYDTQTHLDGDGLTDEEEVEIVGEVEAILDRVWEDHEWIVEADDETDE